MNNFEKLQGRLAAGETILMDGGMGSEIERRGLASPTTWSGGPMLTHPELVREIHQEYIEAGAEVIITNTFGTGRDMLEHGDLEDKVAEANKLGIEAAVQARRNSGTEGSVVIAASVSTMAPKRTRKFRYLMRKPWRPTGSNWESWSKAARTWLWARCWSGFRTRWRL